MTSMDDYEETDPGLRELLNLGLIERFISSAGV